MANPTSQEDGPHGDFEVALGLLRVATESLHALLSLDRVTTDTEPAELAAAYRERELCFDRLKSIQRPAGWSPSAAARATLERIHALDDEMLALGKAGATALRGERHGMQRRRQAIQSQLAGERSEPRLIAVKA